MGKKRLIQIHERDNVAIAVDGVAAGAEAEYEGGCLKARDEIPTDHKIALADMDPGAAVIKYGNVIGFTTQPVKKGGWVHSHNMRTGLEGMQEYTYEPVPAVAESRDAVRDTFLGYVRKNGEVGTRNEIWVIPTVSCVNHTAQMIAERARARYGESCDGIFAYPHNAGCSQLGEDHRVTQEILASIIKHPNAGGVLVVSLGCENNNLEEFRPILGEVDEERVRFMVAQEEQDEIEKGVGLIGSLLACARKDQRTEVPASKLKLGFKCGGSDALSGITANPLCGQIADLLTGKGGTAILTEVPEMFGAETILMNRCETPELFEQTVSLINDFKNYFTSHNQTIYENPSPGNKKGGISTLEDKSLGCTQKSGSASVRGVLAYGEPVKVKGLNLLSAPGNDLVASTALAVSGAHIVLFTTGRGTPFASPVPTVKISSNSRLAGHKDNWIDFNAGRMVEDKTKEEMAQELFDYVLEVASGRKVKAEEAGFHDMAIFKQGVTL